MMEGRAQKTRRDGERIEKMSGRGGGDKWRVKMDAYAKERRTQDQNKGKQRRVGGERGYLWVSLLVGYLQEVDGVPQGRFLQGQGEDQGELLGKAARKHLTGKRRRGHGRSLLRKWHQGTDYPSV